MQTIYFKVGEIPQDVYAQWVANVYIKVGGQGFVLVRLRLLINDIWYQGDLTTVQVQDGWKKVQMITNDRVSPPVQMGLDFIQDEAEDLYITRPYVGRIGWSRVFPFVLGTYKNMRSYWIAVEEV